MYYITREHIFFLFALVLAALIGYVVFTLSKSLPYGLLAGYFVFFFLIGARIFYVAETIEERIIGSVIMTIVVFIVVTTMYGLSAGIIVALSLLACCLAVTYFLSEE